MGSAYKRQSLGRRLANALAGIWVGVCLESSLRWQLAAAMVATGFFLWLGIPPLAWALVVLAMGLVLALELVNTALELLADLVQPDHCQTVRRLKDMAAGAVLVASLTASLVALLVVAAQW